MAYTHLRIPTHLACLAGRSGLVNLRPNQQEVSLAEDSQLRAEVISRLKEWMVATFTGDVALQGHIEHKDAIFTYPNGRRYDQQQHIALTGNAEGLQEHDVTFLKSQPLADDILLVWFDHTLRTKLRTDAFNDPEMRRKMEQGILFGGTSVWRKVDGEWFVLSLDAHEIVDGFVSREERTSDNLITYP